MRILDGDSRVAGEPASGAGNGINIFYMPEQNAQSGSFSPSAGKPALVAKAFRSYPGLRWRKYYPLAERVIALAHEPAYVRDVLTGAKENGFGNTSMQVARSLPYTTGSFVYAALQALREGSLLPYVSPTSGFHHACWAWGGGFCTFNGLMIAAVLLKKTGLLKKEGVGIIDFDVHYGNGTDDIIDRLRIDYAKHIGTKKIKWGLRGAEKIYENDLARELEAFKGCDILFYQAGADPHIDDPLGGKLTTGQMRERDRMVFEFARDNALPIVWNLAGGYQDPVDKVVQLHCNTLEECIRAYRNAL